MEELLVFSGHPVCVPPLISAARYSRRNSSETFVLATCPRESGPASFLFLRFYPCKDRCAQATCTRGDGMINSSHVAYTPFVNACYRRTSQTFDWEIFRFPDGRTHMRNTNRKMTKNSGAILCEIFILFGILIFYCSDEKWTEISD